MIDNLFIINNILKDRLELYTWGRGESGELGLGDNLDRFGTNNLKILWNFWENSFSSN